MARSNRTRSLYVRDYYNLTQMFAGQSDIQALLLFDYMRPEFRVPTVFKTIMPANKKSIIHLYLIIPTHQILKQCKTR